MNALTFALAMAGYAAMAVTLAAAARGGLPVRLWRAVGPLTLMHVILVWAWRYEWGMERALRNGWTAFVVFHAAALMVVVSLWAVERRALILVRAAFLVSTAGALGAVFRRPEVAAYRVPVVLCALLGLGSLALGWRGWRGRVERQG